MTPDNEDPNYQNAVIMLKEVTDLIELMKNPESDNMASLKQIEANRQNALKSTGPKTEPGKAAAALNALKHGLYASTLLLPEEDRPQFDELCRIYVDHYQPDGPEELDLVEEIVSDKWELGRINLIKQGAVGRARSWLQRSDKTRQLTAAEIFFETGGDMAYSQLLARACQMEGRIKRHAERARRDLRRLQQERAGQPQPELPAAPQPELCPVE